MRYRTTSNVRLPYLLVVCLFIYCITGHHYIQYFYFVPFFVPSLSLTLSTLVSSKRLLHYKIVSMFVYIMCNFKRLIL